MLLKVTKLRIFILSLLLIIFFLFAFMFGFHSANKKRFIYRKITDLKEFIYGKNIRDRYYQSKVSQFNYLSDFKQDITMLGDSITDYGSWNELLLGRFSVSNRGINGDTTYGVLNRLDSINSNRVFIMIGINDIFRGYDVEYIFENYKKIVNILISRDIEVVIQSTLYVVHKNRRSERNNKKVKRLNLLLKGFCKLKGLDFIDINSQLESNEALNREYSFDRVHLNGKAYAVWQKLLLSYLDNNKLLK